MRLYFQDCGPIHCAVMRTALGIVVAPFVGQLGLGVLAYKGGPLQEKRELKKQTRVKIEGFKQAKTEELQYKQT
jgi:hypothetical protein